jgi:hypothetical protein
MTIFGSLQTGDSEGSEAGMPERLSVPLRCEEASLASNESPPHGTNFAIELFKTFEYMK